MGQSTDYQPHFGHQVGCRKDSDTNHAGQVGEKTAICLLSDKLLAGRIFEELIQNLPLPLEFTEREQALWATLFGVLPIERECLICGARFRIRSSHDVVCGPSCGGGEDATTAPTAFEQLLIIDATVACPETRGSGSNTLLQQVIAAHLSRSWREVYRAWGTLDLAQAAPGEGGGAVQDGIERELDLLGVRLAERGKPLEECTGVVCDEQHHAPVVAVAGLALQVRQRTGCVPAVISVQCDRQGVWRIVDAHPWPA